MEKLPQKIQVIFISDLRFRIYEENHILDCRETRSRTISAQRRSSSSWNVPVQLRGEMDGVKEHIWSSLSFSQANVSIGRTQKRPDRRPVRSQGPLIHRRSAGFCLHVCRRTEAAHKKQNFEAALYVVMYSLCCGGHE